MVNHQSGAEGRDREQRNGAKIAQNLRSETPRDRDVRRIGSADRYC